MTTFCSAIRQAARNSGFRALKSRNGFPRSCFVRGPSYVGAGEAVQSRWRRTGEVRRAHLVRDLGTAIWSGKLANRLWRASRQPLPCLFRQGGDIGLAGVRLLIGRSQPEGFGKMVLAPPGVALGL